ncbi:MAG: hypothetical protein J5905_03305 [Prevotella sp.]|nr:hypothetical protein [Prevotella sp.]
MAERGAQGFFTDNPYCMARFPCFYSKQNEIVAQIVQQFKDALPVSAEGAAKKVCTNLAEYLEKGIVK